MRTGADVAIVQRNAVSTVTVTALPAYQAVGPLPLRRSHVVGGTVRPVFQRRQVLIESFFHAVPPLFFLLPFSPKRLLVSFLRRVPALACSSALVTVSRSRVTAHFPGRGIPFQTVIRFSRGLSIDELSQVYTFLIACAVYPRGRKSARKTPYFHALGIVVY